MGLERRNLEKDQKINTLKYSRNKEKSFHPHRKSEGQGSLESSKTLSSPTQLGVRVLLGVTA